MSVEGVASSINVFRVMRFSSLGHYWHDRWWCLTFRKGEGVHEVRESCSISILPTSCLQSSHNVPFCNLCIAHTKLVGSNPLFLSFFLIASTDINIWSDSSFPQSEFFCLQEYRATQVCALVLLRVFFFFLAWVAWLEAAFSRISTLLLSGRPSHTSCQVLSKQAAGRHTLTLAQQNSQTDSLSLSLSDTVQHIFASALHFPHKWLHLPNICLLRFHFVFVHLFCVCVCLFTAVLRLFVSFPCCPRCDIPAAHTGLCVFRCCCCCWSCCLYYSWAHPLQRIFVFCIDLHLCTCNSTQTLTHKCWQQPAVTWAKELQWHCRCVKLVLKSNVSVLFYFFLHSHAQDIHPRIPLNQGTDFFFWKQQKKTKTKSCEQSDLTLLTSEKQLPGSFTVPTS